MLMAEAATLLSTETKSRIHDLVMYLLTWATATAVEMVRWPVAGASRHRRHDVSVGRNVGPSGGVAAGLVDSGGLGGAPVRVCQTLSGPS